MADRFIKIDAPGFDSSKDELVVTLLTGFEGISRLFNFQLGLVSKNLNIRPEQFIGKQVDFAVQRTDGSYRHFNGFISRFSAGGTALGAGAGQVFRFYHAEVVPWLWFLTQTTDCRVFNNPPDSKLKALAIIEEVLNECSHKNFTVKNMRDGKDFETEYCVQYRESDFNFISRLMEQFGIYYYFTHQQGSHQLVLSDVVGGYSDCVEKTVSFAATVGSQKVDHMTFWEHDYEFVPGRYALRDYDFKKPSTDLGATSGKSRASLTGHEDYELFDAPGLYETADEGRKLASIYMEQEEVAHNAVRGGSTCRTFSAGHKFTMQNHGSASENGEFVFVSVQHVARQPGPVMGSGSGTQYSNSFACIPSSVPYHPARTTPKPIISSLQSALVVGPKGQEIHCDKYGRVRVRFHWEREGVAKARHEQNKPKTPDEKCTCWMRVSHQVAGNKWGFVALPRVGQEVLVAFLEGNPDRPLIVGSVYNQEQMPHYELPEHKAKTYIKTNSTQGGDGFNELMFDDTADKERLYMHAERDMDVVVKNNSREHIWGNRHRIVGGPKNDAGDLRELIHRHKEQSIRGHQLEHIHGSYTLMVGNGECEDNPGIFDFVIEKKERKRIGREGKHLEVEGDCNNSIGGKLSVAVSGAHHETCSAYALEAGEVFAKGTQNVVIEAGTKLTLKVGGSFITLSASGVDISGPMVNINSGGFAGTGSGPSPTEPEQAAEPIVGDPDEAWDSKTGHKSCKD